MSDTTPASLAVRLSTVAAVGLTDGGKGFIQFTNGATVHVDAGAAKCLSGFLASGDGTVTLRLQGRPQGGLHWVPNVMEARP